MNVTLEILKVDGKDLRNAAHDQAVDIIRHAKSPVKFVVQSLCDPACVSSYGFLHVVIFHYDKNGICTHKSQKTKSRGVSCDQPIKYCSFLRNLLNQSF